MNRLFLIALLLIFSSVKAFSQNNTINCEVSLTDFNTDVKTVLGTFEAIRNEQVFKTKAFRFPGTDLFISASLLHLRNSTILSSPPSTEVVLTLALSKKAYTSIETEMNSKDVVSNARMLVPLKSFQIAELETIYLGKKQPVIIGLRCKE
jgi:hypothetical protein